MVDQTPCPPALAFPSIPSEGFYGPYVRFTGTTSNTWTGSILVVVASNTAAPRLLINVGRASQPIRLATYYNLTFYRFDLSIPQSRSETPITYSVNNKEYRFVVPALGQDWRMLFTSCNGFSLDVDAERQKVEGGIQPLWRDVMEQHAKKPFHVQLGGGDQLYCDEVFLLVPELVQWLEIKDKAQKESSMFNGSMVQNTERYYIMNYLKHFSQEIYKDALAGVPYVFNMDDHDAFDGYGSYPKYLQTHSIITGVGTTAIRFYLLFQHHTTPELARKDGYFGERGYNFIRVMGERAAVLGIDTRSERCLENVVTYDSWKMIEQQLQTIPTSVKHLISIVGIPVTYPRLKGEQFLEVAADVTKTATNFLEKASGFWQSFAKKNQNQGEAVDLAAVFKKTGAYTNILNHFGEGELLDDLNDHWTCDLHDAERKKMVDMLVAFARDRHCRSTILSGDVHCCGISLFSTPTLSNVSDPTFIPNVISSGIGNIPPPKAVITGLHRCYSPLDCRLPTNGVVKESMVELFQQDVDGTPLSDKLLLGRRNWAVVEMLGESLRVEIRVEGPGKKVEEVRGYQFLVPNLE
ncbi:hypothetical protein BKA69DRAFT_1059823 [Paraphysoderma sedebokerense]|nr:hypothetical protein BKA69DRAFT_1059823 [Paraphysoderma sedebokerense]